YNPLVPLDPLTTGDTPMSALPKASVRRALPWLGGAALLIFLVLPSLTRSQPGKKGNETPSSSYDQISPVLLGKETFAGQMAKDKADKAAAMARHQGLLSQRYDLSPRVDKKVTMTRGKPIPVGPATKLPDGVTWESL